MGLPVIVNNLFRIALKSILKNKLRSMLTSLLTLPLAFPGVVVGFMIIMLAGRQGLIGQLTQELGAGKLVFAYSMFGLFLGYLYFSIPRTIVTVMAAAEKMDTRLEEAARSLGASHWHVVPLMVPAFMMRQVFLKVAPGA